MTDESPRQSPASGGPHDHRRPVSWAPKAREDRHDAADEAAAHERDQRLAVRVVAAHAVDAEDCEQLLGMLGLLRAAGLPADDPPVRR